MSILKRLTSFLVICACFKLLDCAIETYRYKINSCSDKNVKDILRSRIVDEKRQRSLYHCAAACSKRQSNEGCRHAIYRQSYSTCLLIEKTDVVNSLPEYVNEDGCTVIHPYFCNPLKLTCDCPIQLAGRFCEQTNPIYCQRRDWRLVTVQDYPMLATSQIPIKMVIGTEILSATSFDIYNTTEINYMSQANGYLVWNENDKNSIEYPPQISFVLHNPLSGRTTTAKLNVLNKEVEMTSTNDTVRLYIPDVLDDTRLVYDGDVGDSRIVSMALSQGFQLLQRGLARVEFDKATSDVYFVNLKSRMDLNFNSSIVDFATPLSYSTYKESLMTNTRYFINQQVSNSDIWRSYHEDVRPNWEVDRCWDKVVVSRDDELLSVLSEYIRRGRELKVVTRSSTVSEITQLYLTTTDVLVYFVPYLSPINTNQSFDSSNKFTFEVINSRKVAICRTDLEGRNAVRLPIQTLTKAPEWYVSNRLSKKVYTVTVEHIPTFGMESNVITAARQGKTIRVGCLRSDAAYRFHGRGYVKISKDNHLLFQTFPILKIKNTRLTFNDVDPNCQQFIWVISTEGWIKVFYPFPNIDKNPISNSLISCDWFVEE